MAPAQRVVRQRKLNKATLQSVLREAQIESAEYESTQNQYQVQTGVEAAEENEYHLQAALKANLSGATEKDEEKEIPAPPAEESSDINYDELYTLKFHQPNTYIRFSDTVEEASGCPYDMTTEDDTFLKSYNQKKRKNDQCTEDDFEKIMDVFELTAQSQSPFAAVDNTVIPFEKMKPELGKQKSSESHTPLKPQLLEKHLATAKDVYEYWKERRQAFGNNSIQPSLKFEMHQDHDDNDPYVCFRRRDVRPTRKTRARDVQSTDKLVKLRKELEEGRQLVKLAWDREKQKLDSLKLDKFIFVERAKLKEVKVKLNIKGDDDDLLWNQKPPQKRKMSEYPQMQRPPGQQIRLPPRGDGRAMDADLVLLKDILEQQNSSLDNQIAAKTEAHRKWNEGYIDLTRESLSPVDGHGPDTGFRPAKAQFQYLMTPPSSVISESFDHASPAQEEAEQQPPALRYSTPEEDEHRQPAYRRRIGRGGRLWIDRRGMSSGVKSSHEIVADRNKYDQDDDDEQPVYEMDPNDTKALRFRATIPYPNHLQPAGLRQFQGSKPAGGTPPNAGRSTTGPSVVAPT